LTKKKEYYSKNRRRKEITINLLSEKKLLSFGFGPIFIDNQTEKILIIPKVEEEKGLTY
jgi:hypothetical protein